MAEVCRAGRGVTVPRWHCAKEAECFLSMSDILMSFNYHVGFPQKARKMVSALSGSAGEEGDAGVFAFPALTLTLLFRSIPGKYILGLLLALSEPAAAEPRQFPRPLHWEPGAPPARTVRMGRAGPAPQSLSLGQS